MTNTEENSLNLKLKNFQSIASTDLTFEQGINLLLGQSNSGKTAIFRAIKAILLNGSSSSKRFIKHGEKEAEASLTYLDNEITWKRTEKDIDYEVNGETYRKAGRFDPFSVIKDTGFVVDIKGELMNMESELQLPFPMDKSPSELFKLFENVFCVSDSSVVLKTYKDQEASKNAELKEEESMSASIRNKINAIDMLKQEVDVDKLKKYKEELAVKDKELTLYKNNYNKLAHLTKFIKNAKIEKEVLDKEFSTDLINEYVALAKSIDKIKSVSKLVKKFKDLKIHEEFTKSSIDEYLRLQEMYYKLLKSKKVAEQVYEIKDFNTDKIDKYVELLNKYNKVVEYGKSIKKLKKKTEVLEAQYNDIQSKLSEYKTCPLCGSKLEE